MFRTVHVTATATGKPTAIKASHNVFRYVLVRTAAFITLTSASTFVLALPHILTP